MDLANDRPLVIFDCDGVLVDSEPIANRVLADLLTELGRPTTTEESLRRYVGRSLPSILDEVESAARRTSNSVVERSGRSVLVVTAGNGTTRRTARALMRRLRRSSRKAQ